MPVDINPSFAGNVNTGSPPVTLGAACTKTAAAGPPDNVSTFYTPGANGSKIEEIVVEATTTTGSSTTIVSSVAGLVFVYMYNGTSYLLIDVYTITAITPAMAGTPPFRLRTVYPNLVVPPGWTLVASQSMAGNANLLVIFALGGDL